MKARSPDRAMIRRILSEETAEFIVMMILGMMVFVAAVAEEPCGRCPDGPGLSPSVEPLRVSPADAASIPIAENN